MKKLPDIFVNNINKKISHNDEVYYSYMDNSSEIEDNKNNIHDIQNKIDNIFKSKDFIYKKKLHIKTTYSENDYYIISRSYDYLLTIDGNRIMIKDILEIY